MILWRLWKNRNDVVWDGRRVLPQDLVIETEDWLREYQKWHKKGTTKSSSPLQRWQRPEVDWGQMQFRRSMAEAWFEGRLLVP